MPALAGFEEFDPATIRARSDSPEGGRSPSGQNEQDEEAPAASGPTRGEKCPASDLFQYAAAIAAEANLSAPDQKRLKKFVRATAEEQPIWLAVQLLKTNDLLSKLQPPEAVFELKGVTNDEIERLSFLKTTSPSVVAYVNASNGPSHVIMEIFKKDPATYGLPEDFQKDKRKLDTVKDRVNNRCTDRRNKIKGLMQSSLGTSNTEDRTSRDRKEGQNIIDLCRAILSLYPGDNTPTVQMCSRIAFLRQALLKRQDVKGPSRTLPRPFSKLVV